jgi:RimJ/RimL family protein N-acetyltransferase
MTGQRLKSGIGLAPLDFEHEEGFRRIADRDGAATRPPWPEPKSIADVPAWVRDAIGEQRAGMAQTFAVLERAESVAGATRLRFVPRRHLAELSYWIAPPYRNRRFGFEAAFQTVDFAFRRLGTGCVEAPVAAGNEASLAIVRRLRMEEGGERLRIRSGAGELETVLLFAIDARRWAG